MHSVAIMQNTTVAASASTKMVKIGVKTPRTIDITVKHERAQIAQALTKAKRLYNASNGETKISGSIFEFVMAETALPKSTISSRKKLQPELESEWKEVRNFFQYLNSNGGKSKSETSSQSNSVGFRVFDENHSWQSTTTSLTGQKSTRPTRAAKTKAASQQYMESIQEDNDSVISRLTDDQGSEYCPSENSGNLQQDNENFTISSRDQLSNHHENETTTNMDNYEQIQAHDINPEMEVEIGLTTSQESIDENHEPTTFQAISYQDIAKLLAQCVPSMRYIPQRALATFKSTMAAILQKVVNCARHNNMNKLHDALKQFLLMPAYVLCIKEGKNYFQSVISRLEDIAKSEWKLQLLEKKEKKHNYKTSKLTRASNQISNGSISKAYRTLVNNMDTTITEEDQQRVEALFPQHNQYDSDWDEQVRGDITLSPGDIVFQIRSLKKDRSPGLTQLRAEHLQQLVSDFKADNIHHHQIASMLAQFVMLMVNNALPKEFNKIFYSGYLLPLKDLDSGKVRPIVMTETLRKVAGKVVLEQSSETIKELFHGYQFGVGISCGIEKIVHKINLHMQMHNHDLVQIDFRNAFNTVERRTIIEKTKLHLPDIYPYIQSSYGQKINLYMNMGNRVQEIKCCQGVQQGDTLGPLLFCLAIHETTKRLTQGYPDIICYGYIDDLTFVGPRDQVANLLRDIQLEYPSIGLQLNPTKCKVLLAKESQGSDDAVEEYTDACNGIQIEDAHNPERHGTILLGSPIGSKEYLELQLDKIMDDIESEFDKVLIIPHSQHLWAFVHFVLKSKLNHVFRTVPPQATKKLAQRMQDYIFKIFSQRFDIPTVTPDIQNQLHANFGKGGFNIPVYEHVGIAAFLASILNSSSVLVENPKDITTLTDQDVPLANCVFDAIKSFYRRVKEDEKIRSLGKNELVQDFQKQFEAHPHNTPRAILSKIRKRNGKYKMIKPSDDDHYQKARYDSLKDSPYTGAGLASPPTKDLQMGDAHFKIWTRRRLGLTLPGISRNTRCLCTGSCMIDMHGQHLVSCREGPHKIYRHNNFKYLCSSMASKAGFCVFDEDARLQINQTQTQSNNRAKLIIPDFTLTSPNHPEVAYDVTVIHPKAGPRPNNAEVAEQKKTRKYTTALARHNVSFVPLVVDTHGQLSKHVITFVKRMSRLIAEKNGGYASVIANYYFSKISIMLQAANADIILDKIHRIYYNKPNGPMPASHILHQRNAVDDFNPMVLDARAN